jgi:hypothetical protein
VKKRFLLALGAAGLIAALAAPGAQASFHQTMISEIHQGNSPFEGDYVELQAYGAGQNLVSGHYVVTYDGGGTPNSTVQLPANVANGANQATILVANDAAATPGADFYDAGLNVVNTGGYVCFQDSPTVALDCVGYGNGGVALPPLSPVGPLAATALPGLANGQSLERLITKGCATALDPADDTNNSAADFQLATRSPRANSVTPPETVCPPAPPVTKPKKCKKKKKGKKRIADAAKKKKKCKKKKKGKK